MLFNSWVFALFLPIVFVLYWFVTSRSLRLQNFLVLLVSYVFYGWWDYRFLSLLFFNSMMDYVIALQIEKHEKSSPSRKRLLGLSLFLNLGMLGFFKYFNFFAQSWVDAWGLMGVAMDPVLVNVILPVGISFYTFQTLSYTIDVYRGDLKATKDPIAFLAFVSFFPQLVAGPIERATNLLPQFQRKRSFDADLAIEGLGQMLWGLFKKIVVADNCAVLVNEIFGSHETQPGSVLALGALLFAFQIYGDFSGYSDIAIGCGKLFGVSLMTNFKYPYFSRDIAEFWRRWHISLSTWFRDYLYIPLGGSRGGPRMRLRNTMIIFIVSGFWHGANWTFIMWGALNAIYFLPLLLSNRNRANLDTVAEGRYLPTPREALQVLSTFALTCLAWIFFRSTSLGQAFEYIAGIFTHPWASVAAYVKPLPFILAMLAVEWVQRREEHPLRLGNSPALVRLGFSISLILLMILFAYTDTALDFIYFQF
jgi:D-alanyl-lipoteichoic acid acyltransferase DltB (MBOAT superfamily)